MNRLKAEFCPILIFVFLICTYNFSFAQTQKSTPFSIHENAWKKAAQNSRYNIYYKYSIYSSRSLIVKHPEVYLQADSVWMESVVTQYAGWQAEYEMRDRQDDDYSPRVGEKINNALNNEIKKDGSEFQWTRFNWTAHRKNLSEWKSFYENDAPYSNWIDLRLPLLWNALKGTGWKTSYLTLAEASYFQERNKGNKCYLLVTDQAKGYVVVIHSNSLSLLNPETGLEIPVEQIAGKVILVMNTTAVWYPLMDRDDRNYDSDLKSAVNKCCLENSVPVLSLFENSLLPDLKAGTEISSDLDKNWLVLFSSRAGKQWGWRPSPFRKMCRYLLPERYAEAKNRSIDNPYELTGLNMIVTEMGNRLSPAAAILAGIASDNKNLKPKEALLKVGNKYYQWFKRNDQNSSFVFGEYYSMWLPAFEDKIISGVGDCFVEAGNVGSALSIAGVDEWDVYETNWWQLSGGGHVISGVYNKKTGEGAVLSNGVLDQSYNGPLSSFGGAFVYTIVYNTALGLINSSQYYSIYSPIINPFCNMDYCSALSLLEHISDYEKEMYIAYGNTGAGNNKSLTDYIQYLQSLNQDWKMFSFGISSGSGASVSGSAKDSSGNPLKNIWIRLYDKSGINVKAASTDSYGLFNINDIRPDKYKLFLSGEFSEKEYIPEWYNHKSNPSEADEISILNNVNDINTFLNFGKSPEIKIKSPAWNSVIDTVIDVIVDARDDIKVKKVIFCLDSIKVFESNSAPFNFELDPKNYKSGKYTLVAKVYDMKNQYSQDSVGVTIINISPPLVKILSPAAGDVLSGIVNVKAEITDDLGIAEAELFLDEVKVAQWSSPPFEYKLDLTGIPSGLHRIAIKAVNIKLKESSSEAGVFNGTKEINGIKMLSSIGENIPLGYFNQPQGVAVDGNGNVYIADRINQRLQIFSNDGSNIGEWKIPAQSGVAVDHSGCVYVSSGNAVFKYSSNGTYIKSWASYGDDWEKPGARSFGDAHDIAVDSKNNIYITECLADEGSPDKIQKFDSEGRFIKEWGTTGSGIGQFKSPRGICIDKSDNVYVVDTYNQRIQVFSADGNFIRQWKLTGKVYAGWPRFWGIAVDEHKNIYLADTEGSGIVKFDSLGNVVSRWTEKWAEGNKIRVQGIAVSKDGRVYVSDDSNRMIAFTTSGEYLFQWGGSSSLGNGMFYYPLGLDLDQDDNLYVADYYNSRIQKFSKTGSFICKWGQFGENPGNFGLVTDIVSDKSGFLYTADFETASSPGMPSWARVQKFDNKGNFIMTLGSYGSGDGQFIWPTGIDVDAGGNVYVVDAVNNSVQKFGPDGKFLFKWGKTGTGEGEFDSPRHIKIDNEGNTYVSEESRLASRTRIQKFNHEGKFITQWNMDNSDCFGFPQAYDLDFDRYGFLISLDTRNGCVKQYTKDGKLINTLLENLQAPNGIAISRDGCVFISEDNINAVRIYQLPYYSKTTGTGTETTEIPSRYSLMQNYPNPFNPGTIIKYSIPHPSFVRLKVYDLLGREIVSLVNQEQSSGTYSVKFDGTNFPSGIYFYRLQAGNYIETRKLMLIK